MPRVQAGILVAAPGPIPSPSICILTGQGAPSAQTPDMTMDNVRNAQLGSLFIDFQNAALYIRLERALEQIRTAFGASLLKSSLHGANTVQRSNGPVSPRGAEVFFLHDDQHGVFLPRLCSAFRRWKGVEYACQHRKRSPPPTACSCP